MITVFLTPENMKTVRDVGLRLAEAMIVQRTRNHGAERMPPDYNRYITGATGEYAVAWAFNLFWEDRVGERGGRDVGGLLDVKTKRVGTSEQRLNFGFDSPDETPCILVHLDGADARLIGWLYAREGRAIGTWDEYKNYWFVEPTVPPLRPITDLFPVVADLQVQLLLQREEKAAAAEGRALVKPGA